VTTGAVLGATALIGIGTMATFDEVVFHQILHWHHFYDRSTSGVALFSDGLLSAFELFALVAGFFWWADLRRRGVVSRMLGWAGFLIGAGGFQLFDGVIDHKVLRVHQVRYDVDVAPYDAVWIAAGAVLLVAGLLLWWRARSRPGVAAE